MIDDLALIKTYLIEKYGSDGSLPIGFGARRLSRDDIKYINSVISHEGIKVAAGTSADVLTSLISKYTRVVSDEMLSSVGSELSYYEDNVLEFDTDGELYEEAFRGAGTYEDYVNKYGFELFKDLLIWVNAFLYAGRDPFDKVRKHWDKYNDKIESLVDNTKNLILVEAIKRYNEGKYTTFTFVANRFAEPECLAIDGYTYPISQLEDVFPVHQHCRCSVILNK